MAKGHHFPLLTLVGVVDADLGLAGGDLRASERTYQLLAQVAGRAGRAERPGRVLLQTYEPDHPVMRALVSGGRDAFLDAEAEARRASAMPPFGRLAAVILSARDEAEVDRVAIAPNARWVVRGDRGLTYAKTPPPYSRVVAGKWWPADYSGPPVISLDAGIARGFGVGVGDTLSFNILGREITATIANLRRIDWISLAMNFVVIFAPGTLEGAPQTHIAPVKAAPGSEEAVRSAVTSRFANITAIHVRDALEAADVELAKV